MSQKYAKKSFDKLDRDDKDQEMPFGIHCSRSVSKNKTWHNKARNMGDERHRFGQIDSDLRTMTGDNNTILACACYVNESGTYEKLILFNSHHLSSGFTLALSQLTFDAFILRFDREHNNRKELSDRVSNRMQFWRIGKQIS